GPSAAGRAQRSEESEVISTPTVTGDGTVRTADDAARTENETRARHREGRASCPACSGSASASAADWWNSTLYQSRRTVWACSPMTAVRPGRRGRAARSRWERSTAERVATSRASEFAAALLSGAADVPEPPGVLAEPRGTLAGAPSGPAGAAFGTAGVASSASWRSPPEVAMALS